MKRGFKNQFSSAECSKQMFELCVTSVLVELLKTPACSDVATTVCCLIVERKHGGSEVECSVDDNRYGRHVCVARMLSFCAA